MKAAFIDDTGPVTNICVGSVDVPAVQPRQVLVRTGAVAVNPIDTYVRSGNVKLELPARYIVGCDIAGTVESVGADVSGFSVGQRVWGSNQGLFGRQGTFAEFAAIDQCWLYPTPDGVGDEDAAAAAAESGSLQKTISARSTSNGTNPSSRNSSGVRDQSRP